MDIKYGGPRENPNMDPEYMAKCASVGQGQARRSSIRERIEDRIQRLREEAFRLEHLAREMPHLSPEAEDAFFQMIARGNF